MKSKIQFCLLLYCTLLSFKSFGKSDVSSCYYTYGNGHYYTSLGEAKTYMEGLCFEISDEKICANPDSDCAVESKTWSIFNYPESEHFYHYIKYIFRNKITNTTFTSDCGEVRPVECPVSSPDDTVLDSVNISDGGLKLTSKGDVDLTANGSPLNTKNCPEQCSKGDPVNFSTGLMWHQETDFVLKGKTTLTDLFFERTYVAQPVLSNAGLGAHWFHNYQSRIFPLRVNGLNNLIWLDEQGGPRVFINNGNNTYKNPGSFFGSLNEYSDRYELIKSDKVKLTFSKNPSIAPYGSLISILEPHGEQVSLRYNHLGLLASVDSGFAGRIIFSYNVNNFLIQVLRERDNLSYQFSYDNSGNLISVKDFSGQVTSYTYQSSLINYLDGLMLSVTDPLGRKTKFQYDDKGRAISETEPGNVTRYYTYNVDPAGIHSTDIRELDGGITSFLFDENYHLVKRISPDGAIQYRTWNAKSLVSSMTDALGFKTDFQYDSQNNLSYIKRPANSAVTTISYDLNFNKPSQIVPPIGSAIDFTIDQTTGDVLEVSRGGLSVSYGYDQFGNILSTDNGVNTYSDQTNANGLKTLVFDARNPETLFYDIRGRLIKRLFLNGRFINYSYDNYDRLLQVKDSHGPTLKMTYDILGRLLTREVAGTKNKELTKYDWDIRNRIIQITDNLGRKTQYQYNAGKASNLVIDKPSAIIAPDGKVTLFKYDIMQRLTKKIEAGKFITSFEYNLRGDLAKLTDAKGNFTTFSYDGNRRLVRQDAPTVLTDTKGISSAAREITFYTYDDRDHLIKEERSLASGLGKKTVTNFTYDSLDRLVNKTFQKININDDVEDSKTSSFTYDSILEAELLKTADNDVQKLSFTHENLPPFKILAHSLKATDAANPLGLLENDFLITRDFSGEIATLKAINGKTLLSNEYDPAGKLTKTRSGNYLSETGPVFESILAYDDLGRRSGVANSDGFVQTLAYDQLSRLNSLNWKNSSNPNDIYNISEQLSYDLGGNIINSKRENSNTVYGYDELNQLTSEHSQNVSRELFYDQVGNRIKDSINGVATFISNAITGDKKEPHSYNTYAYDLDGLGNLATIVNEKEKSQKDFIYNLEGKLSSSQLSMGAAGDSLLATYYYDALGRRVAKNVQIHKNNSLTTFNQTFGYLVDEEKILLSKNGNNVVKEYVDGQGIDEHLGEVTATASKSYITDHLGSVLNTQASADRKMFGGFGDRLTGNANQEALNLNINTAPVVYGFSGRELDLESGLYYNRWRIYNAEMGRFISRDPIGFESNDENFYRYVGNRPVNSVDPSGLICPTENEMGMSTAYLIDRKNEFRKENPHYADKILLLTAAELTFGVGVAILAEPIAITSMPLLYNVASDPDKSTNVIEFVDAISDSLGGPTTKIPGGTTGGAVGTLIGIGVEAGHK